MTDLRHIGLSFGKLMTFHDGLGEFSRQLGLGLAARAAELRERHGIVLHYHLREALHGHFGNEVQYLPLLPRHRFLHWGDRRYALWHSLYQYNRFRPPLRAASVLQTVHDLNYLYVEGTTARRVRRYHGKMQRMVDRASQVLTISQYVAADLDRHLRLKQPAQVIYNGVRDLRAHEQAPLPIPFQPGEFFLHVSRMAPSKNIQAMIELAAAWPESRWVFAGGSSDYTASLQAQLQTRGLRNVVLCLDISDAQKAWAYANCRAFVFPSLTEGFGLPPIEAMYFGRPTFLARRTCLPEIGQQAASYFDAFDPASMRATIETSLSGFDESPSRALVARASHFRWERCVDEHIAAYQAWAR